MPCLISTECSQHSRGSKRSGICSLFLDSQTLLPVHPLMYYRFLDGRTAIELIWFLKAYLKFSNCLQPSEFSPLIISLAVLNLPIIWANLPLPHGANALQPSTQKALMWWQLPKSPSFPRPILRGSSHIQPSCFTGGDYRVTGNVFKTHISRVWVVAGTHCEMWSSWDSAQNFLPSILKEIGLPGVEG